jgi:hypothetical protein
MRKLRYYYAAFLLVCLAGCAQLGLAPAQNFEQKLAYAYGVHTAVLNATVSALDAKTIKSTDAEQVQTLATQSRSLLDAAKVASAGGDLTTANAKLLLGTQILEQLQAYLRSKK